MQVEQISNEKKNEHYNWKQDYQSIQIHYYILNEKFKQNEKNTMTIFTLCILIRSLILSCNEND